MFIYFCFFFFFFFQAEDGIRDHCVTGVQTCALPISSSLCESFMPQRRLISGVSRRCRSCSAPEVTGSATGCFPASSSSMMRSEEHTSELQSHSDLVCRLLLEKKKRMSIEAMNGSQWR